ncbi:MAG TPA: ABC transporter permease [Solirubrobacteraceae bacterium]|nr:ABC transporter permease [Solirubrobacteraceae bacterium]
MLMPIVLIPFVKPALRLTLLAEGVTAPSGAEQAVPGMAVLFGFFLASQVPFGIYNEHVWSTWARLRASPASTAEILVGKTILPLFEAAVQAAVLLGLGAVLFRMHIQESWLMLAAVAAAFSLYLVTFGLAITAICHSLMQVNVITNVSAVILAGLGGALVPESFLPHWATILSPIVPSYWAMEGYRRTIIGGHGGVLGPVCALLAYAALFALVAGRWLRLDDTKTGFS